MIPHSTYVKHSHERDNDKFGKCLSNTDAWEYILPFACKRELSASVPRATYQDISHFTPRMQLDSCVCQGAILDRRACPTLANTAHVTYSAEGK